MSVDLQSQFREAMARVATPVSVVTALADDRPHGSTVSAFASLSMDPPMVLVSLTKSSALLSAIQSSGSFGLNVLGTTHCTLANTFAARRPHDEKFAEVEWRQDNGIPRLSGALGWIACELEQQVEGGDHIVLFGKVMEVSTQGGGEPLTYHLRSYGTHKMLAQ